MTGFGGSRGIFSTMFFLVLAVFSIADLKPFFFFEPVELLAVFEKSRSMHLDRQFMHISPDPGARNRKGNTCMDCGQLCGPHVRMMVAADDRMVLLSLLKLGEFGSSGWCGQSGLF